MDLHNFQDYAAACREFMVLFLPRMIFVASYVVLLGRFWLALTLRRHRRTKGLLVLLIASQAFQLWNHIEAIVQKFICNHLGDIGNAVEQLILFSLAVLPGIVLLMSTKWRSEGGQRATWRATWGPRTELGNTSYFLRHPPEDLPPPPPFHRFRKAKSQNDLRTREKRQPDPTMSD